MIGKNKKLKTDEETIPVKITPISKTVLTENKQIVPGIDVTSHCLITGYVAGAILDCFQQQLREYIFPDSSEFLAACHDVGKISPSFQKMIYKSISDFKEEDYPELKKVAAERAMRKGDCFHAIVTHAVFETILKDSVPRDEDFISMIEWMHHGFKPQTLLNEENSKSYGGKEWKKLRHELVDKLYSVFLPSKNLEKIDSWDKACSIGGLIIVADWIASGGIFSRFTQNDFDALSDDELKEKAKEAVKQAGFSKVEVKNNLSFSSIFGFEPRKIQIDFFDSINGPGVYILEAPMGSGKTEAALYAAYKMLEKGRANGIYFGLPTQLTSNKIFERVLSYLEKITGESAQSVKLKLLHGAAWLEEKVFGEQGDAGGSWFDSGKRGILAPFAVGTIDQALMAVLNVKHEMVRSFGLAGKVVILDEVHSYDAYTGTILNKLIEFLREVHCTVIVLSATLTTSQKKNILGMEHEKSLSSAYPLITAVSEEQRVIKEIASEGGTKRDVAVTIAHNDDEILEKITEKAADGQQILWIENTIADAQRIFKKIVAKTYGTNIECGLIHSRFLKTKRAENEGKWTKLFGKDSTQRTAAGRILVGTQVLEQSLDIDADFLVTRICPTDMLFQRLGRLWRHTKNDSLRPKGAVCGAAILSPEYESVIERNNCFESSAFVYNEYVLCRTTEIWQDLSHAKLPEDIRHVLEATYQEREDEGRLKKLKDEMKNKKEKLERFARVGLSSTMPTSDDMDVQTRYSEIENINVLLLKSFHSTENGCEIRFYGSDDVMEIPKHPKDAHEKRKIAKLIMEHCVTVSEKHAPNTDKLAECFSSYVYTGLNKDDDEKSSFRTAIVGNDSYLKTLEDIQILKNNEKMLYTDKLGYQIAKEE